MTDIVERLRKMHDRDGYPDRLVNPDGPEAAETITALRAEVEALRGAAGFLADRINEMDWSLAPDDFQRDWFGHVEPPLDRLLDILENHAALNGGNHG